MVPVRVPSRAVEPINRTYAPVQAFVDELVRCGLRHAVTCPGSRDAPLVLTLAGRPELHAVSVLDERCAGFFALGMAKATGRPVAIACTSGTAAANLHPAVIEAWEARVPLIVLTADRPPELREVGAGQSIDQLKLYGDAAKWFVEVGTHEPGRETAIHHRALACRAYSTAAGGRPGPVHLNFPLREPLAPEPEPLDAADWAGRPDGSPWTELREHPAAPHADDVQQLAARIAAEPRGAIVCGPTAEDVAEPRRPAGRRVRLAAARRANVGSALRATRPLPRGCALRRAAPGRGLWRRPHARAGAARGRHADLEAPARLGRRGGAGRARPARRLARAHPPRRVARSKPRPLPTLDALAAAVEMRGPQADAGWLAAWRAADAQVPPALAAAPDPFEPKVLAALEPELPDGALVWLSSSMPVRDVEAYFPQSPKRLRFLSNRGANGIDGVVSSAAGAALATGEPAWLLTGELALLHDIGGLFAARRAGADLRVICLNNGGGGIFDFLPVAAQADPKLYEEHIATPAFPEELGALLPEVTEIRTDRRTNVALHREVVERVAAAI